MSLLKSSTGVVLAGLALTLAGCAGSAATSDTSAAKDGVPAAGTASATASPSTSVSESESLRGRFVRVISGDTIELSPVSDKNGEATGEPNVKVHILGIKAPALAACGGPEAAAELKRIINTAGFFRVRYDPQSGRTDSEGKTQGYLYSSDGSGVSPSVGPRMIQDGYAVAWYDNATEDRSVELTEVAQKNKDYDVKDNIAAQKAAQKRKYGIWEKCPATEG